MDEEVSLNQSFPYGKLEVIVCSICGSIVYSPDKDKHKEALHGPE